MDANKFLKDVGADQPGNFKIYPLSSRLHIFLKLGKVPGSPAIDFSVDLPGDFDSLAAQLANAGLNAAGVGNEDPATATDPASTN